MVASMLIYFCQINFPTQKTISYIGQVKIKRNKLDISKYIAAIVTNIGYWTVCFENGSHFSKKLRKREISIYFYKQYFYKQFIIEILKYSFVTMQLKSL